VPEPKANSLAGLRIVVTRAPEQADALTQMLQERGAEVILLPAVAFAPPEDWAALDLAIRGLRSYDWLLLTSQNAVRLFAARCRELGATVSERPSVGCVGPATAAAAREEGFAVVFMAATYRGTALAGELSGNLTGKRVLLPRSDRASRDLPEALRALGAQVDDVVAYRTVSPGPVDACVAAEVREGRADVIVFASPSAVHYVVEEIGADALQALAGRTAFASIGPVTSEALREAGLPEDIGAAKSAAAELAGAIEKWAASRADEPSSKVRSR